MKRGLAVAAGLMVALYAADYLALRFHGEPFGTVQISTYYAVKLKNRKTEIMPGEPSSEECVHSLFPHMSRRPCWYLERHREKRIDVGD